MTATRQRILISMRRAKRLGHPHISSWQLSQDLAINRRAVGAALANLARNGEVVRIYRGATSVVSSVWRLE